MFFRRQGFARAPLTRRLRPQVLAAVDRLLANAGSDKSRILMTQIYLKNIAVRAASVARGSAENG